MVLAEGAEELAVLAEALDVAGMERRALDRKQSHVT